MALALSDEQLKLVTAAAQPLPGEKRDVFMWRVLGYLELHAARPPSNEDVGIAVQLAVQGLVQQAQRRIALDSVASGRCM
jgi:hypothetical protein